MSKLILKNIHTPKIKFYNGNQIPIIGLGTYNLNEDDCVSKNDI
jgi:diketogulonate reductase-like aldo/keto reductase